MIEMLWLIAILGLAAGFASLLVNIMLIKEIDKIKREGMKNG